MLRLAGALPVVAGLAAAVGAPGPARAFGKPGQDRGEYSPLPKPSDGLEVATFAGGCFWCMEGPFDKQEGVLSTTSGYTGGKVKSPSYEQVSAGVTGHAESMQVLFDPKVVSYERLLDIFWHNIDPTTKDREFCDTGRQYRTGVFYHSEAQKAAAEASLKRYEASSVFKKPIVTEITAAPDFWPAEEYHQDYYKKNPQVERPPPPPLPLA